jgi:hypothetical protein
MENLPSTKLQSPNKDGRLLAQVMGPMLQIGSLLSQ